MNRQSIFFTTTVSFIISFILVSVSFFILIIHDYKLKEKKYFDRYIPIVKIVNRKIGTRNINQNLYNSLKDLNYELVMDTNKVNSITYNPKTKVLVEKKHPRFKSIFRVLQLNDNKYIYMKRKNSTILIKDLNAHNSISHIYLILVFGIILITIILIYLITLRKLMPLKILKDKVKTLGEENFDFECCNTDKKDEVSQLAMEFKNTASKLKNLKEARNIFIRNIMHELKTPITKGKILTQLEQNEENNEKLKSVFNRLEFLINEFATIEELISLNKNIDKKHYFLNDVLENAVDILMLEENDVIYNHENKKINVNFKLFTIAVKNLIDNALKYSYNKKVTIKTENENIIFENDGEKLEFELEQYFEPFFSNSDKTKDSFVLGLYIVYNILKANNYSLEYEYVDKVNRFICKKDEKSSI